jgi:hypothetical protein
MFIVEMESLSSKTVAQLKEIAKTLCISGYYKLKNKSDLEAAIRHAYVQETQSPDVDSVNVDELIHKLKECIKEISSCEDWS